MGKTKAASSAIDLLIRIGYFPVHVNLDLLKLNVRTTYPDEILSAAESLLIESSDPDEVNLLSIPCILKSKRSWLIYLVLFCWSRENTDQSSCY